MRLTYSLAGNVHDRYKREEAKIQAWENHEKAKAEAEMRRIEVNVLPLWPLHYLVPCVFRNRHESGKGILIQAELLQLAG